MTNNLQRTAQGAILAANIGHIAQPARPCPPHHPPHANRPPPPPAKLRIAYEETELRSQVKAAGGQWDAESKLRHLPKSAVRKLKLESRLVPESG
jgi:hypothetical protein